MFCKPCSGDLCEIHNFLFMQGLPLLLKRIQIYVIYPLKRCIWNKVAGNLFLVKSDEYKDFIPIQVVPILVPSWKLNNII
jgi:hypothetical protein